MSNIVYASEVQGGLASGSSQALEGSVPLHNERKRCKVSRTRPRKVSRARNRISSFSKFLLSARLRCTSITTVFLMNVEEVRIFRPFLAKAFVR